jgi:RecB family endonuclease NucS
MRIVIAELTADYSGRLDTHLPRGTRTLLLKADGTVLINADAGNKPLNWMPPPVTHTETIDDTTGETMWVFTKKKETLTLTLHSIIADSSYELGVEPGLIKDGVEAHLQKLVAEHPEVVADGLTLVRREYPTPVGPVDILFSSGEGGHVAVEMKRNASLGSVEQITRYADFLNRDPLLTPVRGVLAAQKFSPQARVLAADRNIECVEVDYELLRDGVIAEEDGNMLF